MPPLTAFFKSSISEKWIVSPTGPALFLFVMGHMIENLHFPGFGACAAIGAKIAPPAWLAQGQPERTGRALRMITTMDAEGFGNCSNHFECGAVYPADNSPGVISTLNHEFALASVKRIIQ